MPLSDILSKLNLYFHDYLEHEPGSKKRDLANSLSKKINIAAKNKAPDSEWLDLIIELGQEAHKSQYDIVLEQHSRLTGTLCDVARCIRHEIHKIAPKTLQARVDEELLKLKEAERDYLAARRGNSNANTEASDNALRTLADLGHTKPLLKLYSHEMKSLYPYYQFSESAYLPLVFQKNVADESKQDDDEIVELVTDVDDPEEAKGIVSPKLVSKLFWHLNYYKANKQLHLFEPNKIAECDAAIQKIMEAQGIDHVNTWLEVVIYLSTTADKIQRSGKVLSECAETFSYISHLLFHEIEKNAPDFCEKKRAKKRKNLEELKKKAFKAREKSEKLTCIEGIEANINITISELAYLGDIEPLLALRPATLDSLYPRELIILGYNVTSWIPNMIRKIVSIPPLFEYASITQPYGITESESESVSTAAPLALQRAFTKVFWKKYGEKFKKAAEDMQRGDVEDCSYPPVVDEKAEDADHLVNQALTPIVEIAAPILRSNSTSNIALRLTSSTPEPQIAETKQGEMLDETVNNNSESPVDIENASVELDKLRFNFFTELAKSRHAKDVKKRAEEYQTTYAQNPKNLDADINELGRQINVDVYQCLRGSSF